MLPDTSREHNCTAQTTLTRTEEKYDNEYSRISPYIGSLAHLLYLGNFFKLVFWVALSLRIAKGKTTI